MADVTERVNVKITNEFTNVSNFGRAVDLKTTNTRDYAEILRDVQKQVNVALTQLVELHSAGENIASDDEDGEESSSSEPSKKRKIFRMENTNKKKQDLM